MENELCASIKTLTGSLFHTRSYFRTDSPLRTSAWVSWYYHGTCPYRLLGEFYTEYE